MKSNGNILRKEKVMKSNGHTIEKGKAMSERSVWRLTMAAVLGMLMGTAGVTRADVLYQTNFPDANSIIPASVPELNAVTGNTAFMFWSNGVADGIAGPGSGGTLRSTNRTSGGANVFLEYKLDATSGNELTNITATIDALHTTVSSVGVSLQSSLDGATWENTVTAGTSGLTNTTSLLLDLSGDLNYQQISTVYVRIALPTFLGSSATAVDDFRVEATITAVPEPASMMLVGLGAAVMMMGRRRS